MSALNTSQLGTILTGDCAQVNRKVAFLFIPCRYLDGSPHSLDPFYIPRTIFLTLP